MPTHDFSKYPRTMEQLIALIKEKFPKQLKGLVGGPENQTEYDVALWFLCCQEARNNCETNRTKDWAWIFKDGIPPMNQRVEEFLDTNWYDYMEEVDGKQEWRKDLSADEIEALEAQYEILMNQLQSHFQ